MHSDPKFAQCDSVTIIIPNTEHACNYMQPHILNIDRHDPSTGCDRMWHLICDHTEMIVPTSDHKLCATFFRRHTGSAEETCR